LHPYIRNRVMAARRRLCQPKIRASIWCISMCAAKGF
jgi:hypothetical protein